MKSDQTSLTVETSLIENLLTCLEKILLHNLICRNLHEKEIIHIFSPYVTVFKKKNEM